jgi:precorrin-6B methylase 1
MARVFLWTDGDAKFQIKRPKEAEQSTSRNNPILMLFSGDFNVQSVGFLIRRIVSAEGKVCGSELKTV